VPRQGTTVSQDARWSSGVCCSGVWGGLSWVFVTRPLCRNERCDGCGGVVVYCLLLQWMYRTFRAYRVGSLAVVVQFGQIVVSTASRGVDCTVAVWCLGVGVITSQQCPQRGVELTRASSILHLLGRYLASPTSHTWHDSAATDMVWFGQAWKLKPSRPCARCVCKHGCLQGSGAAVHTSWPKEGDLRSGDSDGR
jgi:hypothetical protein